MSLTHAFAQADSAPPPTSASTSGPKPLAFEVVSIRPSKPGTGQRTIWGTTPDGYTVSGQSLRSTILMAYFPQGYFYWQKDSLSGAPSWIDDLYDISAKVSEADLAEWQKQGVPLDQKKMLRQMLQTMLAERCKLAAHPVPAEIAGYALEVSKQGPRLTEAKPDEVLPPGVKLAYGGVEVPYNRGEKPQLSFYAASMASFAVQLSGSTAGRPVQDRTGLTGKYDFVLSWLSADPNEREGFIAFDDPDPLSHWDLQKLGLKVEPIKLPTQRLVIDHIEKPSEN